MKPIAIRLQRLCCAGSLALVSLTAVAAETGSAAGGMLRTMFGLLIVLAVMGALAWSLKRFSGSRTGQTSVARIVGGVSVGTRERVVVLEVAGRWLVVGVAPGHVSSIADLEAGKLEEAAPLHAAPGAFAGWLKKSIARSHEHQ